jgi:hypothetical protein
MPLAALHTGSIDLVLPPARIAAELAGIAQHPYLAPAPEEEHTPVPPEDSYGDGFRSVLHCCARPAASISVLIATPLSNAASRGV